MTKEKMAALGVAATALSVLLSLSQAFALVGHLARAVDVVGLFASGGGAGAGLTATVIALRMLRGGAAGALPPEPPPETPTAYRK